MYLEYIENLVKEAIFLSEKSGGKPFECLEKSILEEIPNILDGQMPEISMAKWLENLANGILCHEKYKIGKNLSNFLSKNGLNRVYEQFCVNLASGKSISEAMEGLENRARILVNQLYRDAEIQARIRRAKNSDLARDMTNVWDVPTRMLHFMDQVYVEFEQFVGHLEGL